MPDFSAVLPREHISSIVRSWIHDDVPSFDVGGLVVGSSQGCAELWMKSPGVLAGKVFVEEIFVALGCAIEWDSDYPEGDFVNPSDKVRLATVRGPTDRLLRGERTALNTMSRCSGVATAARAVADRARQAGWAGRVAGTRKTTPGFRIVEKYGLLVGGVATHRLDLSQMVMLKDNHIWSAGSIPDAVALARTAAGFTQKIEVECQSVKEALEAAGAGADIVMLDNFEPAQLFVDAKRVKNAFPHVVVEASGGITADTIVNFFSEHVDVISLGKLTQGYNCIDFSLKIVH